MKNENEDMVAVIDSAFMKRVINPALDDFDGALTHSLEHEFIQEDGEDDNHYCVRMIAMKLICFELASKLLICAANDKKQETGIEYRMSMGVMGQEDETRH
jgi:hypothetical protein